MVVFCGIWLSRYCIPALYIQVSHAETGLKATLRDSLFKPQGWQLVVQVPQVPWVASVYGTQLIRDGIGTAVADRAGGRKLSNTLGEEKVSEWHSGRKCAPD